MKYRKDTGDVLRNIRLVGDAELIHFHLSVRDEVERRYSLNKEFPDVYYEEWSKYEKEHNEFT